MTAQVEYYLIKNEDKPVLLQYNEGEFFQEIMTKEIERKLKFMRTSKIVKLYETSGMELLFIPETSSTLHAWREWNEVINE